jgi:SNF2 family DNA or RNA helicase
MDLGVALLHGKDKAKEVQKDADLYVINPDGLQWLVESGHLASLLKRGVDLLVVDELSTFKHIRTKRFKLIKPWLKLFKYRWGLTGSPASNGLLDLFGQIYMLDLGASLGPYITHYRYQYFMPTGYMGYEWRLQDQAEEKIYKAIKDVALSIRAKDHLDLPALVEQDLWVSLPEKAKVIYDDLEKDMIATIENEEVTASNAAVVSSKCRQVASGGVYVDKDPDLLPCGSRKALYVHDEKTEALKELIDELQGAPLLVAYEFDHDLQRIRKLLGTKTPAINGATTDKEAGSLIDQWNKGLLPVLCGHPAAMGHGLNMQGFGSHVCWYSLTWNFELYDQLIRRVWRQGQKNTVVVHRILARKTVDEVVAKALKSKKTNQDALLEALKLFAKEKNK